MTVPSIFSYASPLSCLTYASGLMGAASLSSPEDAVQAGAHMTSVPLAAPQWDSLFVQTTPGPPASSPPLRLPTHLDFVNPVNQLRLSLLLRFGSPLCLTGRATDAIAPETSPEAEEWIGTLEASFYAALETFYGYPDDGVFFLFEIPVAGAFGECGAPMLWKQFLSQLVWQVMPELREVHEAVIAGKSAQLKIVQAFMEDEEWAVALIFEELSNANPWIAEYFGHANFKQKLITSAVQYYQIVNLLNQFVAKNDTEGIHHVILETKGRPDLLYCALILLIQNPNPDSEMKRIFSADVTLEDIASIDLYFQSNGAKLWQLTPAAATILIKEMLSELCRFGNNDAHIYLRGRIKSDAS